MITLITGKSGSGKTKRLIERVNEAIRNSKGFVVCIDKGTKLSYDVKLGARVINTDDYGINGFDSLYGFISGICAGNYDVTDIFVDSTLKIGGKDPDLFAGFIAKLKSLSKESGASITMTVSTDSIQLPQGLEKDCEIL